MKYQIGEMLKVINFNSVIKQRPILYTDAEWVNSTGGI